MVGSGTTGSGTVGSAALGSGVGVSVSSGSGAASSVPAGSEAASSVDSCSRSSSGTSAVGVAATGASAAGVAATDNSSELSTTGTSSGSVDSFWVGSSSASGSASTTRCFGLRARIDLAPRRRFHGLPLLWDSTFFSPAARATSKVSKVKSVA